MSKFKYKSHVITFLVGALFATASTSYAAVGDKIEAIFANFNFIVNGRQVTLDETPLVYNGTSYLPVRSLSNALGLDVTYKADSRTIELTDPNKAIPSKDNDVSQGNNTSTTQPASNIPATTDGNLKMIKVENYGNPVYTYNDETYISLPDGGRKYNVFHKIRYHSDNKTITFDGSDIIVNYLDNFSVGCDAFNKDGATYIKESIIKNIEPEKSN